MKIICWNVDGYSDTIHNFLKDFILLQNPDIIFLSETKKKKEDLSQKFLDFSEYNSVINQHDPARWHGVAMFIKKNIDFTIQDVKFDIPPRKDTNGKDATIGRVICVELQSTGKIKIVGTYVPNSGQQDAEKLKYRTELWDVALQSFLKNCAKDDCKVIWMGDINVAMEDIDVSNPKRMSQYAGFTNQERESLRKFLESGEWIDVWRKLHPTDPGYSWVSSNRREGHGMRLDNFIITKNLFEYVKSSKVYSDCPHSDHVPIGVDFESFEK